MSTATACEAKGTVLACSGAALLVGAAATVVLARSLQDRLAGTWVVPA